MDKNFFIEIISDSELGEARRESFVGDHFYPDLAQPAVDRWQRIEDSVGQSCWMTVASRRARTLTAAKLN